MIVMRRILMAVLITALAVGLSGCIVRRVEAEKPTVKSRQVGSFEAVDFSGYGELRIVKGGTHDVEINGTPSTVDDVTTQVRGGTLYIEQDDRWFGWLESRSRRIEVVVTTPDIERLSISGAGDVYMDDFAGEEFTFDLSGAGALHADDIDFERLMVEMSGAGAAEVAGSVGKQTIVISGAGAYDARDLESDVASVDMSGAGSAVVWAKRTLEVSLSGAGSVEYYGSPKVAQDVSGLGSVTGLGSR